MTTSVQNQENIQHPEEIMKKKQDINKMQNEIKVLRSGGKNKIGYSVICLIGSIILFVMCIINPTRWYYWIVAIVCIIMNIREFLKGNAWLKEARMREQMIIDLETEIRSLERKGI